ncbi:putative sterigmatocystin biosynthesis monooxygenase stcW [Fusarium oxysporum f. sp. albedinis]|nr:putative sterigmatocystin biosynthesis monooxygenase stcW [Fusarium oxysporum f. sp. albedinis]
MGARTQERSMHVRLESTRFGDYISTFFRYSAGADILPTFTNTLSSTAVHTDFQPEAPGNLFAVSRKDCLDLLIISRGIVIMCAGPGTLSPTASKPPEIYTTKEQSIISSVFLRGENVYIQLQLAFGSGYDFKGFQKLIECSIRGAVDTCYCFFNGTVLWAKQELILIYMTSVPKGESNINS